MKRRSFNRGNFRGQAAVFLAVLIVDGALLGAAGGMAEMLLPRHQSWRVQTLSSQEQEDPAVQFGENIAVNPEIAADVFPDDRLMLSAEKQIVLTFDDGPHEVCTGRLLDGLKERGVKATFFLMGESIEGKEELVKRMQEEGHLIGNHSYRHIQLTHANEGDVCRSVERTEDMIEGITGVRPLYLRPPYGDWNEDLEGSVEQTTVFWSVDSLDWKLKNTGKIVRRVLEKAEDGDIILMHDIFPTSVEAALEIIDRLQEEGYRFVTIDSLLID